MTPELQTISHFQEHLQHLCGIAADNMLPQRDERVSVALIGFLESLAAAHGKQIQAPKCDDNGEIIFELIGRRSRYGADLAACLNMIKVRTSITLVRGYIKPEDNTCRIPLAEAQKLLVKMAWNEVVRPLAAQVNHLVNEDNPTYH